MKNEVLDLSFDFAVKIVLYCKKLNKSSRENFVISNQLLKSGTSTLIIPPFLSQDLQDNNRAIACALVKCS